MKRQTIVVIITPGEIPEAWGNLKKACEAKGWKYNTLSKKNLPIEHGGCKIFRVQFI